MRNFAKFAIAALIVLISHPLLGATRYVDLDVTGTSSNAGTSWADAYTNLTSVPWATLSAGDTVEISGGTYGTTGVDMRLPTSGSVANGTSNSPITVKCSQESGHNDPVVIYGRFAVDGCRWVTFNGAKDDNYADTYITNTMNVTMITNNIGLKIFNTGAGAIRASTGNGIDGLVIKWLEIQSDSEVVGSFGISISPSGSRGKWNTEIAYNWFHDIGDDCINWGTSSTNGEPDLVRIHHNLLERMHDDPMELYASGFSVSHNIVRNGLNPLAGTQHPDGIQCLGDNMRINHNIFQNMANSWHRLSFWKSVAPEATFSNLWVYGNLYFQTTSNTYDTPITIGLDPGFYTTGSYPSNAVYDSIYFFNNTMAFTGNGSVSTVNWAVADTTRYTNIFWVNNAWYNNAGGCGWIKGSADRAVWGYTNVVLDFNNASSTNATGRGFKYGDTTYAPITDITNAAPPWSHNNATSAIYVDADNGDFRIAASDTALIGLGTNVSSLALPDIDVDLYGNSRGTTWDIGAMSLASTVDPTLLVKLEFEDSFADDTIDDTSGNGNHAHRFGRPSSTNPTNFPTRVSASATPGTNVSTYAGDFLWYTNADYGDFNKDGQYGAITNTASFTNLTEMTWAVRARYNSAKRVQSSYDYSADGNATLLSAGTSTGIVGTWDMQRFNASVWLNNTRFMIVTNSNLSVPQVGNEEDWVFGKSGRVMFNFPDRGYDDNGNTTNWHHYAATFDSGVIVTYFDGVPLITNDISAITTTVTVGTNNSVTMQNGFIGVGCNTHGGTPALENETGTDYPNHGWFNGQMDDVQLYSRALTKEEIASISGYTVSSGGGGGQAIPAVVAPGGPRKFGGGF